MKDNINPFTPGLVIMRDGSIEAMKEGEDKHSTFFQRIIKQEYAKIGMSVDNIDKEDNLLVLCGILLNDFQILPYQGCTSGNREFLDGHLFINSLEQLTDSQLPTVIDLYSTISSQYTMHILKVDFHDVNKEEEISIGEVYEEMLKRPSAGKKH